MAFPKTFHCTALLVHCFHALCLLPLRTIISTPILKRPLPQVLLPFRFDQSAIDAISGTQPQQQSVPAANAPASATPAPGTGTATIVPGNAAGRRMLLASAN